MTDQDTSQYMLGGMAVSCGILTQEQYEACYYEHATNHSHIPFEDYLRQQNILSEEQIVYLKNATSVYYNTQTPPDPELLALALNECR